MKLESKKTVAIVGCVGAIVATAVLIERGRAESSPHTISPKAAVATGVSSCGDGSAKATADFTRGTIRGALSIGKVMRGSTSEVYAGFELETGQAVAAERPPLDLALVIDHSGSMSGEKIEAAKAAALGIVQRLEERDRVALIQYDDRAEVMVPAIGLDKIGKQKLVDAIKTIEISGGTNLHDGMVLGQEEVRRTFQQGHIARVILLSDGQASDGITDPTVIAAASRKAADFGVRTTAVGLGLDYNEDLMEAIAESGRGNYYYVKNSSELDKVMVGELKGVQATVATNVELRLDSGCGSEISTVIGYESRKDGATTVVPMADLFGNDARKLLVQIKVPADKLGKVGALRGELRYHDPKTNEAKTVNVALALEVTEDQTAATESIDKDVMAQVMSVQAAQTMRDAAAAYDRGDTAAATAIIDTATTKLSGDALKYKISPKAAAPALDSLRDMKTATATYAPSSNEGKAMTKSSKARARVMSKGAK